MWLYLMVTLNCNNFLNRHKNCCYQLLLYCFINLLDRHKSLIVDINFFFFNSYHNFVPNTRCFLHLFCFCLRFVATLKYVLKNNKTENYLFVLINNLIGTIIPHDLNFPSVYTLDDLNLFFY